ncbi:MAG TPA: tetratricopeptide repeat protein [Bacteroidia bacterium]|nr:tetratricopeptide repeat protein [Bacteroidia bacterium]
MKTFSLVLAFFLLVCNPSFGQKHKIDSLKTVLTNATPDTGKVRSYFELAYLLENSNPDSSLTLSQQALVLARKISWPEGIICAMYDVGLYHDLKGEVSTALVYEDSALALCSTYNNNKRLSSIYNVLGNITAEQDHYSLSTNYYFKALAIDSISRKNTIPDLYNNIGLNYQDEGNYEKAESYYFNALRIYHEQNNDDGIATTEDNLANIYDLQGNHLKALENHLKSLKIDSTLHKDANVALGYSNIGTCYMSLGKNDKSLEYSFKAIALSRKIGASGNLANNLGNVGQAFINIFESDSDKKGFSYVNNGRTIYIAHDALLDSARVYENNGIIASSITGSKMGLMNGNQGLAAIYSLQHNYDRAIFYYLQAYNISDSLGVLDEKMLNAKYLGHTYLKAGEYEMAAKYLDKTLTLKDSLFSDEKEKALGKLETKYDDDKKFLEQQKEMAVAAEQDKRQKLATAGVSVGLGLVLIFLFLLFRRFKVTNEQKKVIEEQKKYVDAAYGQLQEKDKDITDSIAYARKIQSAIIPSEEYLKDSLGDYFVLYKPRDVVSGDFYWCHKEGSKVIFAVVDCTGHGVPGAFMSMIGNSMLNQVIIENKVLSNSGEILNQVRYNLLRQLKQRGQESVSRDGMDMAICIWDRDKNILQYSGANNSLYLVRKGINGTPVQNPKFRPHGSDMVEVLADKQPIGYQEGKMETVFTTQTIELKKGDTIYISSDGYQDQFGGEKNKKFTSRAFRDMLVAISNTTCAEQKQTLDSTIEKWKNSYAQTDDICVMGVKIG